MNRLFIKQATSQLEAAGLLSTRRLFAQHAPRDTLSQGHATGKSGPAKDEQAEQVKSGMQQNKQGDPDGDVMDAASPNRNLKSRALADDSDRHLGNPEGVGFAEQVGSQSASADRGRVSDASGRQVHRDEEAAKPGLLSTIKSKLGLGTDAGDVKQNRGGGHGVSGTGTSGWRTGQRREMHSSASSHPSSHPATADGEPSSDIRSKTVGTGKDRPSPVDYVRDILHDSKQQQARPHNLSARGNCRVDGGQQTSKTDKTISSPRRHPRADALRAAEIHDGHDGTGKPSGEWSVAGLGHASSEYRNVSVQDDPYDLPSDDTDSMAKEDSKAKKLRYGGLRTKPDLA